MGVAEALRAAPEAPWARLSGQDVCPQCQTPEERHEVSLRLQALIEREIRRRQDEGVAPDDYEGPLVGYVMAARADDEPRSNASTHPDGKGDQDRQHGYGATSAFADRVAGDGADGVHLRVAFTGAFLTGHPLAIRIEGYEALQQELSKRLRGPEWRVKGLVAEGGTYESGGGFTKDAPLVIARREGADLLPRLSNLLDASPLQVGSTSHAFAPLLQVTPRELAIDVYDLGVAVLTAWFDVRALRGDLPAAARAVKRLAWLRAEGRERSPLADALQAIASAAAADYGEAISSAAPPELHAGAWLSRASRSRTTGRAESDDDQGRLLWLHPVHVLNAHASPSGTGRELIAVRTQEQLRELSPAYRETIDLEGGAFAAGIGWSAVVVEQGSAVEEAPVRLTKLHWAYYALYMEIDRGLLLVLNQERWIRRARLKELEKDAEDVFSDYLRVMDARARLDSHLSALGGDELAVWQTIAKVQRFDAVLDSVARKLDVLDKLAKRRVELATAYRARRAGDILGCLTVLTVVTVAVAILAATRGGRSDASDSTLLRVAIIVSAFIIAAVAYWFAFVRSTRAPAPFTTRVDANSSTPK